ncbi:MAG: S-layer homology domain-containing protein [Ruminococcaceae bacterium]|nr:S-layer homology domain-containing protein [Oscillospiraceae bacterium]
MKNLKKLMSVILTVAMLMSLIVSASAATFTDVDDTNAAYEAIEVLSALEILTGREDGSFDPDANIKRSEFAAVICRTMNAEAAASGSSANFNDVAANHWAAGYIGWAAGSGIVNGKGDGNFDPDANVTYQEAVTMIVRAMGFEPLATKKGGFPTGYMAVANTYGITSGVAMSPANGAATRAGVAKLVYNSFDAPLMDASFITLGDEEEYQIYEGKSYMGGSYDERRTLLSQYSDIYKVKATVVDTYRSDSSMIKSNGDKEIELAVTSNGLYKFPVGQLMNEFGLLAAQLDGTGTAFKALCNDTTVGDLLGYTVNAYLTYNNDGVIEVVALVPDMKSIETMTFAKPATEISAVTVDPSASPAPTVTFSYWENDKLKDAKMAPAASVGVYVNGVYVNTVDNFTTSDINNGTYSSVILLGSKATGLYNKIMLTEYKYAMVESVDAEMMTITCTNGTEYTLNPDDLQDEFTYAIYKDGAEITLADIAEGDMLNIISDDTDDDFTDDYFADIYVSNEVIEATVSQFNPSTSEYTIDGAEYELANNAEVSSLNAGDSGIFYLTIDGYVYDAELTKGFSGNYAFVIDMALDTSSFGQTWQIKMLTKDNTIVTYDVKSNAKINGSVAKNDACTGTVDSCAQCVALASLKAAVDTPDPATADVRLISYNLSGDELSVINSAASFTGSNTRDFNKATLTGTATYNANTERLAGYNLLSGTVVFNAPFEGSGPYTLDENKVQVYAVNALDEDVADYEGFVYDIDSDRAIGAALITNSMGFAGKANALAVVKSVSTGLDAAGNSADIVNFFQAGEMKSLAVTNDAYLNASFDASDLSAGDIFQYTTNAAGEINNMVSIFDMAAGYAGGNLITVGNNIGTVSYATGIVTGIGSKFVDLDNGSGAGWDLDANGTNVLFDVAKAGANLNNAFDAKSGIGYIKEAKINAGNYTSDVYVVVAKVDDGAIVEVVTYKYTKDATRVAATFNGTFTVDGSAR